MENIRKKTFSIGDTAKICGVSQKQLRNWEARGYIPRCDACSLRRASLQALHRKTGEADPGHQEADG